MPKMKTHKAAAKRFRVTGGNKLLQTKGPRRHLRRKKSARVKRLYGEMVPTSKTVLKRVRRLIPYGA